MIYYALLAGVVILAAVAIELKDLLHSVIVLSGVGVLMTFLFFLLQAPDIAITQAVVEAALITVIYVIAISRTSRREE